MWGKIKKWRKVIAAEQKWNVKVHDLHDGYEERLERSGYWNQQYVILKNECTHNVT